MCVYVYVCVCVCVCMCMCMCVYGMVLICRLLYVMSWSAACIHTYIPPLSVSTAQNIGPILGSSASIEVWYLRRGCYWCITTIDTIILHIHTKDAYMTPTWHDSPPVLAHGLGHLEHQNVPKALLVVGFVCLLVCGYVRVCLCLLVCMCVCRPAAYIHRYIDTHKHT
jgi:hypothetical protein